MTLTKYTVPQLIHSKSPSPSTLSSSSLPPPPPSPSSSLFPSASSAVIICLTIITFISLPSSIGANCPARMLIKPCTCIYKNKGFDVTCEGANGADNLRDSFENLVHLGHQTEYLKIIRSNLPTLPAPVLSGLKVVHLIIHYNNLSEIESNALSSLELSLESLDLSQNLLSTVPSGALKNLKSLVSLTLSYNQIQIIPAKAFDGLNSLLRLSLFGNQITTLDSNAFTGVGGNLTIINLGFNRLNTFPTLALANLTSLSRLQLHENQITSISSKSFANFSSKSSLDTLNLAGNLLTTIPNDCFSSLSVLSSLDLEANQISKLNLYAFRGIENKLEWLKLNENKLTYVPSESLVSLTKLRQLDLRNNNISIIRSNDFKGYGLSVKFVYLQKNSITKIEDTSFDPLIGVEWMYLHSNLLKTLEYSWFKNVLQSGSLAILDVHNNPLTCSCSLTWLNQLASDHIMSMPKETKCTKGDSIRSQPVLDFVSQCTITSNGLINNNHNQFTLIIHSLSLFILIFVHFF